MRQCGARPRAARISCGGALLALACSSAPTTSGTNVDGAAGADLGGAALLTAETTSVDFGLVFLGDRSSSTFYVTNAGGNALARPTLTVDNAVFRVLDRCLPGGIAPGDGCEILVEYFPTRAGEQTGTLTITARPAPTAKVALAGRGLPAYAGADCPCAELTALAAGCPMMTCTRLRWQPSGLGEGYEIFNEIHGGADGHLCARLMFQSGFATSLVTNGAIIDIGEVGVSYSGLDFAPGAPHTLVCDDGRAFTGVTSAQCPALAVVAECAAAGPIGPPF